VRETSEGACPPSESRVLLLLGAACGFGMMINAPDDDVVCCSRTDEEEERRRVGGVCRDDSRPTRGSLTADTRLKQTMRK
jgi:hypothetical protein